MSQSANPDTNEALSQAIVAVKAKQWTQARAMLSDILRREPDNTEAWLWLSATLRDPLDQERCLLKVLELEPEHPLATQGLQVAQDKIVTGLQQQAHDAMEQNNHAQARELLLQLVERDEDNLQAWVWLSSLVETAEEQEICFENILTLDPDHQDAQQGLALLHQAREIADIDPTVAVDSIGPFEEERIAPTLAGDILGEDFREKFTTVIPEPEPVAMPYSETRWAEVFTDPLHCPYCTAPTEYEDKRCPVCQQPLWERSHQNPKRSSDVLTLFTLQAASAILLLVMPAMRVVLIGFQLHMSAPSELLSAYIGSSAELDPALIEQAHAMLSPGMFWLGLLPALVAMAMAVAIYVRWRPVYYVLIGSALISFFSSILAFSRYTSGNWAALAGGLVGLALSVMYIFYLIKLEPEFAYRHKRILLEEDKDLKDGIAYLRNGKIYASKGMWAKAALHFRKASVLAPKVTDGFRTLASACIQLGEWAIAQTALETAHAIAPNDEHIITRLAQVKAHQEETR